MGAENGNLGHAPRIQNTPIENEAYFVAMPFKKSGIASDFNIIYEFPFYKPNRKRYSTSFAVHTNFVKVQIFRFEYDFMKLLLV